MLEFGVGRCTSRDQTRVLCAWIYTPITIYSINFILLIAGMVEPPRVFVPCPAASRPQDVHPGVCSAHAVVGVNARILLIVYIALYKSSREVKTKSYN